MLSSAGPWPRQNFCLGCLVPSLHLGTVCTCFQQSDQQTAHRSPCLRSAHGVGHPRSPEHGTALFLHLSACFVVCLHAPELLEGRGPVWFASSSPCQTPAHNKCLMNDWKKECSSSENCSSEPCTSALPGDVFIRCGFRMAVSTVSQFSQKHW